MKPKCPYCKSTKTASDGYRKTAFGKSNRRQCKNCRKYFTVGSPISMALAEAAKTSGKKKKRR
jgi:transcriptional regulator NrdR family protein